MRLLLLAAVLSLAIAAPASAYPAAVHSGHYAGTAQDRNNVHFALSFDVDYHAKLVKNFTFHGHNLGTAALTIRHTHNGEEWLFAETSHGPPVRRFAGSPTGPTSFSGDDILNDCARLGRKA